MTATSTSANPLASETPLSLLFPDVEQELATTRRILERVPDGKNDWRPHEKSMTLDGLATHVAQLPGFGVLMLTTTEFDRAKGPPMQAKVENSAERLKLFDDLSSKLTGLLKGLTWETAMVPWAFRFGD